MSKVRDLNCVQAYIGQGDGSRWTLPQRSSMVDASTTVPDPLLDEPEKAGKPIQ